MRHAGEPSPARPACIRFAVVENPEISVVILAWKLVDPLLACLSSLVHQTGAPGFEVVLVDNGAHPAVRDAVAATVTGVTVVELPANVGFGAGCNAGVAVARGRFVVFLNDDARAHEDWLGRLHAAAVDGVGAVGSLLLNRDGTVQGSGSRIVPDGSTLSFGAGLTLEEADRAGLLDTRSVDYAAGAALLVRRDLFCALGGFDDVFDPAYYEDVDLQMRIRQSGYDVVVEPAARVVHDLNGSTKERTEFREWASIRSAALFRQRWSVAIAGAPTADAARGILCPVTSEESPTYAVRALPSAESIAHSAWERSARMHADFADYLARGLRTAGLDHSRAVADADRLHAALTAAEERIAGLAMANAALVARNDLVETRLRDLDARSLWGLLRWRLGRVVLRQRARRAEPTGAVTR